MIEHYISVRKVVGKQLLSEKGCVRNAVFLLCSKKRTPQDSFLANDERWCLFGATLRLS